MKIPKCMFCQPHELSGIGLVCLLLRTTCNGLGERCVAFKRHTKESRQALLEAIEIVKKEAAK